MNNPCAHELKSRAAARHGTWRTARITVVAVFTVVILCFHGNQPGVECARLYFGPSWTDITTEKKLYWNLLYMEFGLNSSHGIYFF